MFDWRRSSGVLPIKSVMLDAMSSIVRARHGSAMGSPYGCRALERSALQAIALCAARSMRVCRSHASVHGQPRDAFAPYPCREPGTWGRRQRR